MNTNQPRLAGGTVTLAALVGTPCRLTRVGQCYDGRGTLAWPELDGQLLRCPEVGKPLWLLVGESNWVRTSPVASISDERDRESVRLFVRTGSARYSLVFRSSTTNSATDRTAA